MNNLYASRNTYFALITASLLMGLLLFGTSHLDFIIAACNTGKMNLPNIAYILLRIVSPVLIPAALLVPSMFEFGRIKTTKALFIVLGVLYALTTLWIAYFAAMNGGSLFSYDAIYAFQESKEHPFVASYVLWDTYNLGGTVFSLLYAAMLIYTGISFDDNRVKVRICMLILLAARILLPILNNLLFGGRVLSMFWITNNYADVMSLALLTAGVFIASLDDRSWIELIWDEHGIHGLDDGEPEIEE